MSHAPGCCPQSGRRRARRYIDGCRVGWGSQEMASTGSVAGGSGDLRQGLRALEKSQGGVQSVTSAE